MTQDDDITSGFDTNSFCPSLFIYLFVIYIYIYIYIYIFFFFFFFFFDEYESIKRIFL